MSEVDVSKSSSPKTGTCENVIGEGELRRNIYRRKVQFYETDSMAVVHHSNYLRFFEEARLEWISRTDLLKLHAPYTETSFAVISSGCEYRSVCKFGEEIRIEMQMRQERSKIRFQYAIYAEQDNRLIATGYTLHIALDPQFRVLRLPEEVIQQLEKESWTETWPLNL